MCVIFSTFSWARSSRFGLCLRAVAVPFTIFCSRWALCQVIIPLNMNYNKYTRHVYFNAHEILLILIVGVRIYTHTTHLS